MPQAPPLAVPHAATPPAAPRSSPASAHSDTRPTPSPAPRTVTITAVTVRPGSARLNGGRSARYNSSFTRDASSTTTSDAAENPRTVASTPGSPTIRDPFGGASEVAFAPSPFGRTPSFSANASAFRRNSADCRSLELATSPMLAPGPDGFIPFHAYSRRNGARRGHHPSDVEQPRDTIEYRPDPLPAPWAVSPEMLYQH